MAQYTIISLGDPLIISRGTLSFRYAVRSNIMYLDQTKTTTGFAGVQPTDWDAIETYGGAGTGLFRVGARSLNFCLDEALDATGFSGAEDVNWINIEKNKLP